MSLLETSSETLITLFHLILNIKFAWCNSSRIERDNCCQRERSGGKDMPPIRNRMHQVKLHQRAFMASGVKWIRCKLHVIVDWKWRCNNGWTLSKHSMSLSGKTNSKLRTWLQKKTQQRPTTNGCGYIAQLQLILPFIRMGAGWMGCWKERLNFFPSEEH